MAERIVEVTDQGAGVPKASRYRVTIRFDGAHGLGYGATSRAAFSQARGELKEWYASELRAAHKFADAEFRKKRSE